MRKKILLLIIVLMLFFVACTAQTTAYVPYKPAPLEANRFTAIRVSPAPVFLGPPYVEIAKPTEKSSLRPTKDSPIKSVIKPTPKPIITSGGWRLDNNISWFGPGLYGNGMACGGKLTKQTVGVAHKTLKCGTKVSFKWKGVVVTTRVVDRGPYVRGRQFDMTRGLCKILNHCYTGKIYYRIGK